MVTQKRRRKGFSLLELVIVVVIVGIIAAVAIPRMSRGSAGAADSALKANLAVLRSAIEQFAGEHGGQYPGNVDGETVSDQLTLFTDAAGNSNATKTTTYYFGPYLRKVPPLPLGNNKNNTTIAETTATTPAYESDTSAGWLMNVGTGNIWANTSGSDDGGASYVSY